MLYLGVLLLSCLQGIAPPPGVKVANERIVLNTKAGLIVIAVYSELAPKNVDQVMQLVIAGAYDGTCIARIEKGFVMQFSAIETDRVPVLPESLRKLIKPLPAEFSKLKHVRGTVSMAREDNDINSAKTSFSILLGPAPHLDDKYTIIGHVEYGMDVVDELVKTPLAGKRPRERLAVLQAGLVMGDELMKRPPPSAKVIFEQSLGNASIEEIDPAILRGSRERQSLFSIGLLLMIGCLLISVFVPKVNPKQTQTLNLTAVLIGSFLLVAINFDFLRTVVMTNTGYGMAIAIFFGLLGVFRLMSRFESAS